MTEIAGIETTPDDAARHAELARRVVAALDAYERSCEDDRRRRSVEVYGHAGAHIPHSFPTREGREAAVLALFEPEIVTTAAELDALPVGSVVRDTEGAVWVLDPVEGWFWRNGDNVRPEDVVDTDALPLTVLHRGGDRG